MNIDQPNHDAHRVAAALVEALEVPEGTAIAALMMPSRGYTNAQAITLWAHEEIGAGALIGVRDPIPFLIPRLTEQLGTIAKTVYCSLVPVGSLWSFEDALVTTHAHVLGVERVLNPETLETETHVTLADHSGTEVVVATGEVAKHIRPQQVVDARIHVTPLEHGVRGRLDWVYKLSFNEIDNPIWALPKALTPAMAQRSLQILVDAAQNNSIPHVASFIAELVLFDYEAFLMAPAAFQHHHAYRGGLLIHTANVWQRLQGWLESDKAEDQDIALAAVIAHDIGKIRKTGEGATNPVNRYQPHELLGLELINGPLRRMGEKWDDGAARLHKVLYWLLGRSKHRDFRSKLGEAIALADRVDASMNLNLDKGGLH